MFYESWQALMAAVKDPALECWIRLEPGALILINNQRVMHGRSAITAASGRILVGCYIRCVGVPDVAMWRMRALALAVHSVEGSGRSGWIGRMGKKACVGCSSAGRAQ